jgi:hypothetical protein
VVQCRRQGWALSCACGVHEPYRSSERGDLGRADRPRDAWLPSLLLPLLLMLLLLLLLPLPSLLRPACVGETWLRGGVTAAQVRATGE